MAGWFCVYEFEINVKLLCNNPKTKVLHIETQETKPMQQQEDIDKLIQAQSEAYSVPGVDASAEPKSAKRIKLERLQKTKSVQEKVSKPRTVYVSGLPLDVTKEEVVDAFQKYGILLIDVDTGEPKVKLYTDEHGKLKGDALVSYFKPESVELCINLMHDTEFRFGSKSKISVSEVFEFLMLGRI
jgi:HIV Tat-specific factor 1